MPGNVLQVIGYMSWLDEGMSWEEPWSQPLTTFTVNSMLPHLQTSWVHWWLSSLVMLQICWQQCTTDPSWAKTEPYITPTLAACSCLNELCLDTYTVPHRDLWAPDRVLVLHPPCDIRALSRDLGIRTHFSSSLKMASIQCAHNWRRYEKSHLHTLTE